jgi:hypothetical protein
MLCANIQVSIKQIDETGEQELRRAILVLEVK